MIHSGLPGIRKDILFLSFLLGSFFVHAGNEWVLKKNENGIAVYTRDIPGSNFKELKATTIFNASLPCIVALIKDVPSHTSWIFRCNQTRVIKMLNSTELYYYHETYVPWPASNRDGVVYYKISQDIKTKIVTVASKGIAGMVPLEPNKVRVPEMSAFWNFVPKDDGTVYGEYQLYVDPGGDIPSWMVNMFAVDGPYNSILNMKKMLTLDKYKSAKIDFIKD